MDMTFVDELNRPLPGGTALKDPCTLHEGIVAYMRFTGQQVMIHKSQRIGRPAVTLPSEFANGKCGLVRTRTPQTAAQGEAIVLRAWLEVQRGTPWTVFDNCEDFVANAYTGRSGSHTRNFIIGLIAVGFFCVLALGTTNA
jgi:hypothetical protein